MWSTAVHNATEPPGAVKVSTRPVKVSASCMWSTAEPPSIQSLLYRGEHATEADATVKVPKVSVAEHRTEAAVKVPAAVCGALQYIILQNHLLYRSLSGQYNLED